jgi:hypothetical protein
MLLPWLALWPRKQLYRASIYSCYQDYKECFYSVKRTDPSFDCMMDATEYDKLSMDTKNLAIENSRRQRQIVDETVFLVKVYCKQFPDEKICKYCNFKTYDEYPYRLHQTMHEFIGYL